MKNLKYLALAFLLCIGGKAFAQGFGYGYPTMPQFHSAGGGGNKPTAAPTATATPGFLGANSPTTSAGGNYTVTLPTGGTGTAGNAGNVIFAVYEGASFTPGNIIPQGWQDLTTANTSNGQVVFLDHVVRASDGTTVIFPLTTAGDTVCMAAYSGVSGNMDTFAHSFHVGASTTVTPTTITTRINGSLVLIMTGIDSIPSSGALASAASGFTDRVYFASVSGTTKGCDIEDKILATAGAVGAVTFTITNASSTGSGIVAGQTF